MPVKIPLSVDQQQLLNDLIKQKDSWGKIEAAVKDYGNAANKEEMKRIRQAKAIIKSQRTEQEVLKEKIAVLRAVGNADATQKAEANAAIKKLIAKERERARKSTEAYREERRQIDAGVRKVGELKKANRSLDEQYDQLRASIKKAFEAGEIGANDAKRAMAQLNQEQKNAKKSDPFAGGVGKLASYAAGVASVGTAINAVQFAYRLVQEEIEKGMSETERLERSRGNIAQISDASNFTSRLKTADDAAKNFGIDRAVTAQALFDITSNRRLTETDKETRESFNTAVQFDRAVPAEVAASFIGEFRKVFDSENMTARESVVLGLSAAANSAFNIQQLQPQLRTAGQGAKALPGASSSDVAAVTATLAALKGEETGLAVKNLQANAGARLQTEIDIRDEAAGKLQLAIKPKDKAEAQREFDAASKNIEILSQDLIPIIESLADKNNKGLKDLIIGGNRTLLTNFLTMASQIPAYKEVDKNIEADVSRSGTARDLLATKQALLTSDRIINSQIEKTKSEIARDISAEERFAEQGNAVAIEANRLAEKLNDERANAVERALATGGLYVSQTVDWMRGIEPTVKATTDQTAALTTAIDKQTKAITNAVKSNKPTQQAEAIE